VGLKSLTIKQQSTDNQPTVREALLQNYQIIINNYLHGVVLSPAFTMEVYWNFTVNNFLKDGEDLS